MCLSFIHQSSGPKQTSNQNLPWSEKVARCWISSAELVKHNWKEVFHTHPDPQTLEALMCRGRVTGHVGQTNYAHFFKSRRHIRIIKYSCLLYQKSQKNWNLKAINLCQAAIQIWDFQTMNYYGWGPFFRLFYRGSFLWLFTPSKP